MRKCLLIFFLSFLTVNALTQLKNNKWIVGFYPLKFTFTVDSLQNEKYETNKIYYQDSHSLISDSNSILFSCNGFNIINRSGEIMENGKHIVPNHIISYTNGITTLVQQSIIIPKNNSQYYVFVWSMSDGLCDSVQDGLTNWRWDILTYSVVDLSYNGGLGMVISKENYLIEHDTLAASKMSAVLHANGRDWWLIKPHLTRHRFYTFLVTPNGITEQPIQEFNEPVFENGVNGQSNFSKDGSLYALTSSYDNEYTQVNGFDRCTGKMSKLKSIPRIFDSTFNEYVKVTGVCFSPNNRFVYLINNLSIQQYDLETDERIELNVDSVVNPAGNTTAYLGANDRIYIGNYNETNNRMSYIKYPDRKGLAAEYCHLCYVTNNINTAGPPNMPNYELGALIGSPCDTIGKLSGEDMVLYPNPTSNTLIAYIPQVISTVVTATLYNLLGEVVIKEKVVLDSKQRLYLPVEALTKGMYVLKVTANNHEYIKRVTKW